MSKSYSVYQCDGRKRKCIFHTNGESEAQIKEYLGRTYGHGQYILYESGKGGKDLKPKKIIISPIGADAMKPIEAEPMQMAGHAPSLPSTNQDVVFAIMRDLAELKADVAKIKNDHEELLNAEPEEEDDKDSMSSLFGQIFSNPEMLSKLASMKTQEPGPANG